MSPRSCSIDGEEARDFPCSVAALMNEPEQMCYMYTPIAAIPATHTTKMAKVNAKSFNMMSRKRFGMVLFE
jgi:hypothetical protein